MLDLMRIVNGGRVAGAYAEFGSENRINFDGARNRTFAEAGIRGWLDLALIEASLDVRSLTTTAGSGTDAYLAVVGNRLWSKRDESTNQTLEETVSFSKRKCINYNYGVAGVGLNASVCSTGTAGVEVDIAVARNNGAGPAPFDSASRYGGVENIIRPFTEFDLEASATLDALVARGGMRGVVKLLDAGLPIESDLDWGEVSGPAVIATWQVRTDLDLTLLDGHIDVFVDHAKPGWCDCGRLCGYPCRKWANVGNERLVSFSGAPFWGRTFRVGTASWQMLGDLPDLERARAQSDDAAPSTTAPDSSVAVLSTLRQRLERGNSLSDAVAPLLAYLRRHPAFAAKLVDLIADDAVPRDHRSSIFFALERVGTDAARSALVDASRRSDLERPDRLRAIAALSDFPAPDPSVVGALEHRWSTEGTRTPESRSTLLALGQLQGRTDVPPELRRRSAGTLRRAMEADQPRSTRLLALEAVGNGGAAARRSFGERIQSFVDTDDPEMRRTAHATLRRIGAEAPPTEWVAALQSERSLEVRREIGRRLTASSTEPSPAAIHAAAELLEGSNPTDIDMALVDFLGPHAEEDPRAQSALIGRFRRGAAPELLVRIGRYVPAHRL